MSKPRTDAAWWEGQWKPRREFGTGSRRASQYVTMRDGVRLALDVYLPADLGPAGRLPAILCQTRYHRRTLYNRLFGVIANLRNPFLRTLGRFMSSGYALVIVDVRGTGASFGSRRMEWSPEEVRDGAEVVDWITAQSWSNGLVGVTGTSYAGTAAEMLLVNRHPAVKAAQIRFAPFDIFADITHPGGVRNRRFLAIWSELNDALDRNAFAALARKAMGWLPGLAIRGVAPVDDDAGGRLLGEAIREHRANYSLLEALSHVECRDDRSPAGVSFEDFSPHAFTREIGESGAAIYSWSSYYDGANTLAAIKRFLNVPSPESRLVLGPWEHGGMQNPSPFARTHTSCFDHAGEILRFFDFHLKGVENGMGQEKRVHYFTTGEERWNESHTWPPPGFHPEPFYFAEDRRLSRDLPADEIAADRYRVDPSAGTGLRSRWEALVNMAQIAIGYPDRREQDRRLIVYQTDPLQRPVEVTGHPVIVLYLRSTATDGCFFAYLEDVSPDGPVHYVCEGVLRAIHREATQDAPHPCVLPEGVPNPSYRRGDAKPLTPGEPARLAFGLLPVSHRFAAGHAIRVAIAGADKDNFEPSPPPVDIDILRSRTHPSHILLPIRNL